MLFEALSVDYLVSRMKSLKVVLIDVDLLRESRTPVLCDMDIGGPYYSPLTVIFPCFPDP